MLPRLGTLAAGALLACCLRGSARADDQARISAPRLIVPGGHAVEAGQVVALSWAPRQEISELEILLSLDDGRTYPVWVSPRLPSGVRRFVWRVPACPRGRLRMRIRYNLGGREIEGPPTAAIAVLPPGAPQPLGLPPAGEVPKAPGGQPLFAGAEGEAWTASGSTTAPPRAARPAVSPRRASSMPPSRSAESAAAFLPLRP